MRLKKNCRLAHWWSTMGQVNEYEFYFYNISVSSLHFFFGIRLVCSIPAYFSY